jgi:hypothetical protein
MVGRIWYAEIASFFVLAFVTPKISTQWIRISWHSGDNIANDPFLSASIWPPCTVKNESRNQ